MTFSFSNISLFDIVLSTVIAGSMIALIWEFIPDGLKQYWNYRRQIRRDEKKGRKGKYSFT